MTTAENTIDIEDLRSVHELAAEFPRVLSVWTLREQLRHRRSNGLASACVPVGRRLLISKSRYQQWLASRLGVPSAR